MATCIECGTTFKAQRYDADFCCTAHRNAFNNRRRDRGAILYDLAMIEATDPKSEERYALAAKREALMGDWIGQDRAAGLKRSHKRVIDVVTSRR